MLKTDFYSNIVQQSYNATTAAEKKIEEKKKTLTYLDTKDCVIMWQKTIKIHPRPSFTYTIFLLRSYSSSSFSIILWMCWVCSLWSLAPVWNPSCVVSLSSAFGWVAAIWYARGGEKTPDTDITRARNCAQEAFREHFFFNRVCLLRIFGRTRYCVWHVPSPRCKRFDRLSAVGTGSEWVSEWYMADEWETNIPRNMWCVVQMRSISQRNGNRKSDAVTGGVTPAHSAYCRVSNAFSVLAARNTIYIFYIVPVGLADFFFLLLCFFSFCASFTHLIWYIY